MLLFELGVIFEAYSTDLSLIHIYVWADEFKTEQVIRNYVSNAFHHLDGDRVVEGKMAVDEERVKVTVFNTGTPIPEEDLPQIWDKFYKVDKAHTREYGGNGIGLSIVKAIMKSLHQQYGVNNYDNLSLIHISYAEESDEQQKTEQEAEKPSEEVAKDDALDQEQEQKTEPEDEQKDEMCIRDRVKAAKEMLNIA